MKIIRYFLIFIYISIIINIYFIIIYDIINYFIIIITYIIIIYTYIIFIYIIIILILKKNKKYLMFFIKIYDFFNNFNKKS